MNFGIGVYDSIDSIPEYLPFEKSIVRYENKSPKDSEYWQPISTKKQLVELFYTSLRCKTNKGKYYCVREYKEIGEEYRCFWHNGLIAVFSESDNRPNIESILEYINSIKSYIFYNRCVFDIAQLKNKNNKYIFIEFNSWETNSGAHRFDWKENTELFYTTDRYCYAMNSEDNTHKCIGLYSAQNLAIRWQGGEIIHYDPKADLIFCEKYCNTMTPTELLEFYEYVEDYDYMNTFFTETHIFCLNDIWLGKFDKLNLECQKSVRGVFRFNSIEMCENGKIYDGEEYYYSDLSPYKISQFGNIPNVLIKTNVNTNIKYGFVMKNKKNKQEVYLRLLSDFVFMLDTGNIKFIIQK